DLGITASAPATAIAGDPAGFTYTLTVENEGPSDNTGGYTVTNVLPAGTTFVASGSDPGCTASGQTVTCTSSSGLASGATRTILIHVTLASSEPNGTILADNGSIASNG